MMLLAILELSLCQLYSHGQSWSSCLQLGTYVWGHQSAASAFKEVCAEMKTDKQPDSDSL